jgi:undecaprenyl diphosphate synthase
MKKLEVVGFEIPKHIAFIMDGNGRWAKRQGKKRTAGHKAGSKTLKAVCKMAYEYGVEYVTVYAFSTENWKRSEEEVAFLMMLLRQYLKDSIKESEKNNMQIKIIGRIEGLPNDIQKSIQKLEEVSKEFDGLKLQIALNYGGRDELIRGFRVIGKELINGQLTVEDITEKCIDDALDTKGIPDPDLMIRTSGEYRLSNFLLWQLAYTEFYFTDVLWPDFNEDILIDAIKVYNMTDRRFGGIKDET